jgi:hypothetical protein
MMLRVWERNGLTSSNLATMGNLWVLGDIQCNVVNMTKVRQWWHWSDKCNEVASFSTKILFPKFTMLEWINFRTRNTVICRNACWFYTIYSCKNPKSRQLTDAGRENGCTNTAVNCHTYLKFPSSITYTARELVSLCCHGNSYFLLSRRETLLNPDGFRLDLLDILMLERRSEFWINWSSNDKTFQSS